MTHDKLSRAGYWIIIGLLLFLFFNQVLAVRANPPGRKFEYLTVRRDEDRVRYNASLLGRGLSEKEFEKAKDEYERNFPNAYGAQGWELVWVTTYGGSEAYIFKRGSWD